MNDGSKHSNWFYFSASGRVQGVGYRYYVQSMAIRYGVRGAVWNVRDGRVELLVKLAEDALDSWVQDLWRGPSLSRVDAVLFSPRSAADVQSEMPKAMGRQFVVVDSRPTPLIWLAAAKAATGAVAQTV